MTNIYARINLLWSRALPLLLAALSALHPASAAGDEAKDPAAEMNRILAKAFQPDAPGAAVLVVQNGTVKLRKGYGLANLESRAPMDPSAVLPICSITKQFTAVAILQLAEAGKLKLTDDLATWVPDYPTGGAKVTLAQLLSNMSGIPSVEEQPEWRKSWESELTPNQVLDFTRNKPLEFEPGSNFKYSNTGYTLLGLVIEKASGQSYPDYVRTHIFAPAAMSHSGYPDSGHPVIGEPPGYSRTKNGWETAKGFKVTQAYSAGALFSTVDDMWAWEKALQTGRLVGTSLLQSAYTEGHLPDGRGTRYGFGWEINKLGTHTVIEHAGGMPGYAAYEARVPDSDLYLVILANTYSPSVPLRTLVHNLIRVALDEPVAAPATFTSTPLEEFVGKYRIDGNMFHGTTTFEVAAEGNRLFGHLGSGRRPLKRIAADEFTTRDEWHFTFVRDNNHRVQKVLVRPDGPGPDLVWPRVE
jgi:CubicO group peptidase (beta-lactamase class C family)